MKSVITLVSSSALVLGGCASMEEFSAGLDLTSQILGAYAANSAGTSVPPYQPATSPGRSTTQPTVPVQTQTGAASTGRTGNSSSGSTFAGAFVPPDFGAQNGIGNSTSGSGGGHSAGAVATHCLRQGPGTITNGCATAVDFRFCYVGSGLTGNHATFACSRPSGLAAWHGPGGHHLAPGETHTFGRSPQGQSVAYRAAACLRPYTLMYARYDGRELTFQCIR